MVQHFPLSEAGAPQRGGPHGLVEGVGKMAVLRANALGDLFFALPALDAVRAAYPGAEIVLLGSDWHRSFLDGRPGPVDRVVSIPPTRGIREDAGPMDDPAELDRFFRSMRRERFDLALQLHGGGRNSNPFVRRLGARLTAGLRTPDADPLDRWVPYIYFHHEVLRCLEAVALVGARPVTLEPRLFVTRDDLEESRRVVPDDGRPLVVLHAGATDARRRWPSECFAEVGDGLAEAGARVLVTGTSAEESLAGTVVRGMKASAVNLAGRLSLTSLAGVLSRAGVVVGNDTGPLHLARAVGASTVGIYWWGNLLNFGPITRSRHRAAVSWRIHCPVCGTDCLHGTCEHRSSFTADVPVADVLDPALSLLEESPERPREA